MTRNSASNRQIMNLPYLSAARRRCWTGMFALAVLLFNLVAGILIEPQSMALDGAPGLADICHAAFLSDDDSGIGQADGKQGGVDSGTVNCVFCLPFLSNACAPLAQTAQFVLHELPNQLFVLPADTQWQAQSQIQGSADPRAPPVFS